MQIFLTKNEILALRGDSRGLVITNQQGALWLTQANDPTDYLLLPQEHFIVQYAGSVLLEAQTDTAISLICNQPISVVPGR